MEKLEGIYKDFAIEWTRIIDAEYVIIVSQPSRWCPRRILLIPIADTYDNDIIIGRLNLCASDHKRGSMYLSRNQEHKFKELVLHIISDAIASETENQA
mgnify:CR=1 FL=1